MRVRSTRTVVDPGVQILKAILQARLAVLPRHAT
jgi:hypothetical protein